MKSKPQSARVAAFYFTKRGLDQWTKIQAPTKKNKKQQQGELKTMNWEALLNYLLENWPQLAMQIGTLVMVIKGKPKTEDQIQKSNVNKLAKRQKKNAKLREKLKKGYEKEDELSKKLEEA